MRRDPEGLVGTRAPPPMDLSRVAGIRLFEGQRLHEDVMSEKKAEQAAKPRSNETPAVAREAERVDALMRAPSAPAEPKPVASEGPHVSDEALARQEIKLSLDAEKRLREVKSEAAKDHAAQGEPEKPLNPDG